MHPLAAIAALIVAILAGTLLLLAFLPFRFAASGTFTEARVDGRVAVTWGPMSVDASPDQGAHVRLLGRSVYRARLGGTPDRTRPATSKKRRRGQLPQWRVMVRIVRRVITSLHLSARIRGRVGTGDPADTAHLFGAIALLRNRCPEIDWDGLQVDWLEPRVDLEGEVGGRVVVASVAWIAAREWVRSKWTTNTGGAV